ncbi:LacI family DNA-binding transcriptional regulator [Actinomycetospora termitidis]|uniref:LacI family DNA-binding transcriptional regulator n=1 Tax=Actinomycetospora termitidis TaxID=3053470 RepID=A0ABT7M5G8_9PSEU|nr:LacI family DNA-binding transcriptional regulator [Actinomycetospora sp. Odt1-22]MDL5155899.1 LacI family DNA-binding transcriptional regulator [Actinomycetospora sp. Odt1-22]
MDHGSSVRVTIDDVARAAGVSRQTVSRAMNDKGDISEATRRKVLATIEELDYRPSAFARGMRTQKAGTLALIIPDITNPFFPAVARGAFDAAAARGLGVVVHNTDADPAAEAEASRRIVDDGVAGAIAFFEEVDDGAVTALGRRVPLVVADRHSPDPTVASVRSDFATGTRTAIAHLRDRGHVELGMLDGAVHGKPERRRAFLEALGDDGDRVVTAPATVAGGTAGLRELLARHPGTTAVFAFNDLLAIGAVRALKAAGRRVPGEVAVVGYDDIPMAALVDPPLTTVHTDKYELGRTLVEVLGRRLDGHPAEHRTLAPRLVVRGTS